MTLVRASIQRQHTGSHDLGGEEAGVVDGESFSISHDFDGQTPRCNHPGPKGRQPYYRFVGAQSM
jgi:hypothetical protein